MKLSTFKKYSAIGFGLLSVLLWILLFLIGLLIDSSYYRAALNFGYDEFSDWLWVIVSFTMSNVALLAFLAGLLGGICSKIIITEGFTLTKKELLDRHVDYVLFENPFISAFRGVFMFLIVLSLQYLSSFSDLGALNGSSTVKETQVSPPKNTFVTLMDTLTDPASRDIVKKVWLTEQNTLKEDNIDTLINRVLLLRDSIEQSEATKEVSKINLWEQEIRFLRKKIKASPVVETGISYASYFKFAIIVSLLAFICGYDPSRFNSFLSKIPLLSKKEMEEKK